MKHPHDIPRPTESELDILNIIWDRGPSTVRQVHDYLSQFKPSQYTTTLKLMQIMADKGLLRRDETDRSRIYHAQHERGKVQQQLAAHLMNRVFGGSAQELLVGALGGRRASKKELAELRQILADHEKGTKR